MVLVVLMAELDQLLQTLTLLLVGWVLAAAMDVELLLLIRDSVAASAEIGQQSPRLGASLSSRVLQPVQRSELGLAVLWSVDQTGWTASSLTGSAAVAMFLTWPAKYPASGEVS